MRILEIGRGVWTVGAIADSQGNADVLDFLVGYKDQRQSMKMMAWLREAVPQGGPESLGNEKTRRIATADGIWEFRIVRRRRPGLRVLWFYDENKLVVCTHAFEKVATAPPGIYGQAEGLRGDYFEAKQHNRIEWET